LHVSNKRCTCNQQDIPFVINLLLVVDVAPDQVGVVPQQADDRVVLVHEDVRAALDLEDALAVDVGRRVLREVLAPLVALLGAHVALVEHVGHADDGVREDRVGVPVAHVGLLVGRDALDVDAHGDGEGRAVLEQLHLVDERCPELVRGDLGVGVGAHAEDPQLHALDRAPHAGLGALHREVGEAAGDVDHDGAGEHAALLDGALVASREGAGDLRDHARREAWGQGLLRDGADR
jgi:hypothetical protein